MTNQRREHVTKISIQKRHQLLLRRTLLLRGTAIVSSLMLAGQAIAQDQDQDQKDEETQVEEVIITGSRIKRDAFSSSSPMDIVVAEDATRMGFTDLASMLQATTVAAGYTQVTSASSTAFVQNGGAGTQTISLRGLGANRTLSLLNGRRAGPAGTRGSVSSFDMNVLPLAGIQSVEILKDGASSIYGSDAVAGVINYITKKGDGGEINANISQPTVSGGETYQVSASYGQGFERGYFRVTADYYREEELAKGDRDYFACGESYVFEPGTNTRADLIDPRTGETKCTDWGWGHVWTYDYADPTSIPSGGDLFQYDYNGHLAGNGLPSVNELANALDPNNPDLARTPPGWYPVGYDDLSDSLYAYDHPYQNEESLIPKKELFTIMAEGDFEISDGITAYAEALFNRRETTENHYRQYWSYLYGETWGGRDIDAGWTGTQWYSPTPVTDHADSNTKIDYMRGVVGFKGEIGASGWDYDTSFQYSKSDAEYGNDIIFKDAVWSNNPAGWQPDEFWGNVDTDNDPSTPDEYIPLQGYDYSGSCVGTTTVINQVPCIDVDWMNPENMRGNITDQERAFLFGHEIGTTVYKNYSLDVSFANSNVFELPAGGVGIAVGAQYMFDSINDQPGAVSQAGNSWGAGQALPTVGDQNSTAAFAEGIIPLLANIPLVQRLELSTSVRYTDVSTYGSGTTYKLGLDWQVNDTLRFRAGHGTSFRSPALFELFVQAESSSIRQSLVDPCYRWGNALGNGDISQRVADNCAAEGIPEDHTASITADILASGGAGNLDAETSVAKTVGMVLTPGFADFKLSIDYFDIEVNGQIDQLGAQNIVYGCYDSVNYPTDPLCDLFDRNPYTVALPGMITNIRDKYINIASQRSRGVDITATYTTTLPGAVDMNVYTQHTFTTMDETEIFKGFPESFKGRAGHPEWVGNLTFSFLKGPWSATWNMRGVGSTSNVKHNNGVTTTIRNGNTYDIVLDIPRVVYHNVSVGREFGKGFSAILGMSNAFDKEPPQVSRSGVMDTMGRSAFYSQYDWRGRRVFLNLKKTF